MLRTNIVLDEKLIQSCIKATGIKTKRAVIDFALHEILRHEKQKELLKLRGKVHWKRNLTSSRSSR